MGIPCTRLPLALSELHNEGKPGKKGSPPWLALFDAVDGRGARPAAG